MTFRIRFSGKFIDVPGMDKTRHIEIEKAEQLYDLAKVINCDLMIEKGFDEPTILVCNDYVE